MTNCLMRWRDPAFCETRAHKEVSRYSDVFEADKIKNVFAVVLKTTKDVGGRNKKIKISECFYPWHEWEHLLSVFNLFKLIASRDEKIRSCAIFEDIALCRVHRICVLKLYIKCVSVHDCMPQAARSGYGIILGCFLES